MPTTDNQTLSGRIILDDTTFTHCRFVDAQLVYAGGGPPGFVTCVFEETSFTFEGPAHNTIHFLRAMSPDTTGLRAVVANLIPEFAGTGDTLTFRASAND